MSTKFKGRSNKNVTEVNKCSCTSIVTTDKPVALVQNREIRNDRDFQFFHFWLARQVELSSSKIYLKILDRIQCISFKYLAKSAKQKKCQKKIPRDKKKVNNKRKEGHELMLGQPPGSIGGRKRMLVSITRVQTNELGSWK